MCRSMVDIRSTAAEIRRGKKKKKESNYRAKIYMVSLLHRATIKEGRKKLQGKNIMAPLLHRAAINSHVVRVRTALAV